MLGRQTLTSRLFSSHMNLNATKRPFGHLDVSIRTQFKSGGRTGLMVRASDSGSGDPGSILGRVGVLFP